MVTKMIINILSKFCLHSKVIKIIFQRKKLLGKKMSSFKKDTKFFKNKFANFMN